MLSRDEVMAAATPKLGTIEVSEWGGEVAVRKLGALDVVEVADEQQAGRRTILLVRHGVCTPDGVPMFSQADDEWLARQPWDLMLKVAAKVSDFSGISTPAPDISGN